MYLWDKNMTKDLTPWLEELFPQYNINFVITWTITKIWLKKAVNCPI